MRTIKNNNRHMKKIVLISFVILAVVSCKKVEKTEALPAPVINDTIAVKKEEAPVVKTWKEIKEELTAKGFQTYHYIDHLTKDTILVQQYFMAFLKNGTIRSQNEEEADLLQQEHVVYLKNMQELGYADISGSLGDQSDIRSVTIYNVPTLKMADSLAKADPLVKAGRVNIEIHPWWVAKASSLR